MKLNINAGFYNRNPMNPLNKWAGWKNHGKQQSGLPAIAARLQSQAMQKNRDMVTLSSRLNDGEEKGSSIYSKPAQNFLRRLAAPTETDRELPEIPKKQLLPPSERNGYTQQDALLNQYMKQYRPNVRIEMDGDSLTLSGDRTIRLVLPDMVSDEELENFRSQLRENGLGTEIDWQGVRNDFVQMGIYFGNVERMDMKADYLTSRYAVLKDRIQKQYAGEEQAGQMEILEDIYQDAKERMVNDYAENIGGFYEDLGQENVAGDFRASLAAIIDEKAAAYSQYISENSDYAAFSSQEDRWLLDDDAYMAAQLREAFGISGSERQTVEPGEGYSMEDLMFAGVYAHSLSSQINSLSQVWDLVLGKDDGALGSFFAEENDRLRETVSQADISDKTKNLLNSIYKPYMEKVMDAADTRLDEWNAGNRDFWIIRANHIDRSRVYQSFYGQ